MLADLTGNWLLYLSMPLMAAIIGYVTKLVAIQMLFKPVEFVGKPPLLGWQGVIPRNAGRMASIAMDLLLGRLIDPKELLGRLDAQRIFKEIEQPLSDVITEVGSDLMVKYQPDLWEVLPLPVQRLILGQIKRQAPKMVEDIMRDFSLDMERYIDVRDMAITNLTRDRAVLNRLIREVGDPEMRFIARSGLYFGLLLGVLQAVVWMLTHNPLVMPIFGALIGLSTDWIALKMIFYPRQEKRFLGFIRWQGMFQKRRAQVSADYGRCIAAEVLTMRNLLEALLTGPKSDALMAMVQRRVQEIVDRNVGFAKPFVVLTLGSRNYRQLKQDAAERAIALAEETMSPALRYAEDAIDVENVVVNAMHKLTPVEFEGVLRPAFKQDEWKVILVGGILGAIIGELQVQLILVPFSRN